MSITRLLIQPEVLKAHRARWFVYAGGNGHPTVKIPREATMRGHWVGYDVSCSCGWESRTGGAIKARVEEMLLDHRFEEQCKAGLEPPGSQRDQENPSTVPDLP